MEWKESQIERVAIYARISKKDSVDGYCGETRSISNQIQLAKEFILMDGQLSKMQIQIFKDEGYTGTHMERPAVQKLLANIYLGRIQALVIKDFSRLSRNHLQLSELREHIIRKYPIILISIGECYDNRKREEMDLCLGMKSVFYEYYCRDVSRKVKQSISAKKKAGEYAVAKTPFGYRKDISGRFVIEKKESEVVKNIFRLAEEGWNTEQIAKELSQSNPEMTKQKGWSAPQIWRIINNPVYTGSHVWHKYESRFENGFVRKAISREDWEKQESMHPAIISSQQYIRVQMRQKRTEGFGKKKGKRHLFQGISKCGICKKALCRHRRRKELLCCREKHEEGEIMISERQLWEICRKVWEIHCDRNEKDIDGLNQLEKKLFLKYFVKRIEVEEKKIWIQWKPACRSDIIEENT